MLTPRLRGFLAIIRHNHRASYVELCALTGISSKNRIHEIVVTLENRGYITRTPINGRQSEYTITERGLDVLRNLQV